MDALDQEIQDLKFKMIYDKLESNNEKNLIILNEIKSDVQRTLEQTKKTNGRVTALECWKSEHELSSEKNLLEYNFMKKYPKLMFTLFVAMVLLTIINIIK